MSKLQTIKDRKVTSSKINLFSKIQDYYIHSDDEDSGLPTNILWPIQLDTYLDKNTCQNTDTISLFNSLIYLHLPNSKQHEKNLKSDVFKIL